MRRRLQRDFVWLASWRPAAQTVGRTEDAVLPDRRVGQVTEAAGSMIGFVVAAGAERAA
jgi:hypothetical protein